jgi:penicillin-binding protein 1C
VKARKRRLVWLILSLGGAFLLFFGSFYIPVPKRKLNPRPVISLLITDRNGLPLREVLSDEGGRCRWVRLDEISPFLVKATLDAEDRHFFVHSGVNPYAIARAFIQNFRNQKVVSGASTITQQVVRNVYRFRRNLFSKILEAWLAVRLEHSLSKENILVQYFNRISYGNQAYGIEAASRLYFDKPASDLSLAEAAFLATIPRSPSLLNPYRNFRAVEMRQKELLHRMAGHGSIAKDESQRALEEKIGLSPAQEKFRAPHFCDYVLAQIPGEKRGELSAVRTTLDYSLQEKIETLLKNHLGLLEKKGIANGAVLVLDNAAGDILAMAGSKDFFDERNDGQVNGTLALRQPGSTLKPLTYALALEKGMTAATIIEDVPTQFPTLDGHFAPENYDEKYHGPIRLRSALASSYNIPAVSVLQSLGPDLLYRRLKDLEFASLQQSPEFYGVGLTLGNGEVTLLELTRAYACLARKGLSLRERSILKYGRKAGERFSPSQEQEGRRIFSPEVSYIITHILADRDARVPTFGYLSPLNFHFPVAAKTGTSKDFRDNWTIGYTPAITIGVWVGNFDGRPMHNVSGMTGAGPLFRDVMLLVSSRNQNEEFREPTNLVHRAICPLSGKLPSARCPGTIDEIFLPGTEPRVPCSLNHQKGIIPAAVLPESSERLPSGVEITFPQDGDIFKMDPVLRKTYQSILLKASVNETPGIRLVEWRVNGRKIGDCRRPYSLAWNLSPGSYTIRARALGKDGAMESRPVKILVIS